MAVRGRKPKPTELKILRGTRKDRINEAAPKKVAGVPPCPSHLDAVARAKWDELVEQLGEAGTLSRTDSESLALYCSTFSLWLLARQHVSKTQSLTVTGAQGGTKSNPILSVIAVNAQLLARLQAEFGLTPSSRGRIQSSAAAPKDELEEFVQASKRKAR
jgi:P27 family predicted phage terminase small subunit